MRILITPFIEQPQSSFAYYLASNLAWLFSNTGHTVAISAEKDNHFHHVSLYPSCSSHHPFTLKSLSETNYEEWLYAHGAISEKYLLEDYDCIEEAVVQFQPDLIITIDRIAANLIARKKHIRIWSVVHSDMYMNYTYNPSVLKELNKVLTNLNMEQIFYVKEIYARSERRLGFGPIEVEPFHPNDDVTRIGITSVLPPEVVRTNRVCIFLHDLHKRPSYLKKIITEAFKGAPYSVYAWFDGSRNENIDNIHFLSTVKAEILPGSIACIHDGNTYFTNQCLARGIRQLIITDHDYIRNSNALAAERNKFGLAIFEEELSMNFLYERYRLLLSNDRYYYYTQSMKNITRNTGDLTILLNYL